MSVLETEEHFGTSIYNPIHLAPGCMGFVLPFGYPQLFMQAYQGKKVLSKQTRF